MLAPYAGGGRALAAPAAPLLRLGPKPTATVPPPPSGQGTSCLPLPLTAACSLALALRRRARTVRFARADWSPEALLKSLRGEKKFPDKKPKLLQAAPPAPGDAKAALVKHRQQSIKHGRNAMRPCVARLDARLPLVIKYHKPFGIDGVMRSGRYRDERNKRVSREDLRSVVAFGGDKFELDYYEPVGQLGRRTSGLMLWTRRAEIAVNLLDETRLITSRWRAIVAGAVDEEELREMMREGVNVGDAGFEELCYADLKKTKFLPVNNIQRPISEIDFATRMDEEQIRPFLQNCGYEAKDIKRRTIGAFRLYQLGPGKLAKATAKEEEWVCGLAECPEELWPAKRLPEAKRILRQLTGGRREEEEEARVLPRKERRTLPA